MSYDDFFKIRGKPASLEGIEEKEEGAVRPKGAAPKGDFAKVLSSKEKKGQDGEQNALLEEGEQEAQTKPTPESVIRSLAKHPLKTEKSPPLDTAINLVSQDLHMHKEKKPLQTGDAVTSFQATDTEEKVTSTEGVKLSYQTDNSVQSYKGHPQLQPKKKEAQLEFKQEKPSVRIEQENTSVELEKKEVPIKPKKENTPVEPKKEKASTEKQDISQVEKTEEKTQIAGASVKQIQDAQNIQGESLSAFSYSSTLITESSRLAEVRPEIVLEAIKTLAAEVETHTKKTETTTLITIHKEGIFKGAEILVTSFTHAKGEVNIQIANLTQEAKTLLEQNAHHLKQALDEKGITVHMLVATTAPYKETSIGDTAATPFYRDSEERGQKERREGEKEQQQADQEE